MSDWRQIQARIRKAKNSQDPSAKLSELFQRTRDGMVAWELGALEEKNERMEEAVKWYSAAAHRFRRADWKKKAEEALARLGVAPPPAENTEQPAQHSMEVEERAEPGMADERHDAGLAPGEIPEPMPSDETPVVRAKPSAVNGNVRPADDAAHRRRARGRRGGRGRRRKGAAGEAARPAAPSVGAEPRHSQFPASVYAERTREAEALERPEPPHAAAPAPMLPSERIAHGRAGDPALASRMAHLESMLRRLVASPLHRLDEADQAPAGPGVFLLSDSDQISSYYVESCQTLRIGIGNLARGGQGNRSRGRGQSDSGLKAKLAEHLGIGESRVSQYLRDHCIVRWIQLDEDAPHLAHFAIGVLRTPLNL